MLFFLIPVLSVVSLRFTKDSALIRLNSKGPTAWNAGVGCLTEVGSAYFYTNENFTRPGRLLLTYISGMSSPAAEIAEKFHKVKHEMMKECVQCREQKLVFSVVTDSALSPMNGTTSNNAIMTADSYVIVIDFVERLQDFIENHLSKTVTWNPGAKFLILYNNDDHYDRMFEVSSEVFGVMLESFYVTNVLLLFASNTTSYEVLQLDYFERQNCRSAQVKQLTTCHSGKLDAGGREYVKHEVSKNIPNLQNCTFRLCAKVSSPFVEDDCQTGLEMYLVEVIQEKIGFSLECNHTKEERGVFENGSWTNLLAKLEDRLCDFIIGGFYPDNEVRNHFWVTVPYLSDSYTWFIQKAPLQPAWKGLITIFAPNTWLLLTVVLLITWIFWFTIGRLNREAEEHRSVSLTAIYNFGATLGASVNDHPKKLPLRLFFMGLILFGLNMTSIYTSNLMAVFTNPKLDDQVKTIEEVIRRKIPFGGPKESRDWFSEDIFKLYNFSSQFEPTAVNFKSVVEGKRAILANRMYVLQSNYSDDVYAFHKDEFISYLQMIMGRGFPLMWQFNKIIKYMGEGGILSKINNDFTYNNTIQKYIRNRRHAKDQVIALRMVHLGGAFTTLLLGLGFSIIVFALEILVHNYIMPNFEGWREWNKYKLLWGEYKVSPVRRNRNNLREEPMKGVRFTPISRRKIA